MTVSFCVIAYNEEEFIPSLWNDICHQIYPHNQIEVVFVNAMSTDRTKEIMNNCVEQKNEFRRIVVIDNPKQSQASGWNRAILESEGDIIIRVDAHTKIPANFVSENVRCIQEGENVCGGPRPNIAEDESAWKHTLLLAEKSMFGSSIASYRRSNHKKRYVKSVFHGAYRKEVFQNAGLFNENLGRTEDNEMHYRITRSGYKICYDPKIISYQHTRNSWKKMIKQKYGNGYWIGLTIGVCRECFAFYHFVPLAFVLAIAMTLLLSVFVSNYIYFIILISAYMFVNLIMSIAAVYNEKKLWQYILLPIIFLSLHISYGLGTVVGVVIMPFWKRKVNKKE